ncbi:50S ribosomal protein L7/L12 [Photobacterium aquae]|uniref:50S ribosomal protein L7/L12 n=1 Tax=Photobacterium aquae TaxID=1195763 RepID=A0A0J1GWP4_9GAMM|nr:GNAT family protein [Photobacterium aquae]KLV03834.1 50S ribosomal protein L7/L12 [Photobacterium aquae]
MFTWKVDDELELALVTPELAPSYVELVEQNRAYLSRWLEWPRYCATEDEFRQFGIHSLEKYASGKGMNFSMVYQREVVGNISYNTIDHHKKKVELGYWLAEPMMGRGIVTRCCRHLIDYAFDQLNMEKVQIAAAKENSASRAVCERLGMTLEGVITNEELVGDRILDHAIYGLHRLDREKQ